MTRLDELLGAPVDGSYAWDKWPLPLEIYNGFRSLTGKFELTVYFKFPVDRCGRADIDLTEGDMASLTKDRLDQLLFAAIGDTLAYIWAMPILVD